MQSNIDCIIDDLNEFPDSWVELFNESDESVDLSCYYLGDTDNPSTAFRLPNRIVAPGEYIIIYCDKTGEDLHTDFRLDSGKGAAVYLFKDNEIVDCVTGLKKQPAPNIAYGKLTENSETWGYQKIPTPGIANCGTLVDDILPDPVYSVTGQVTSTPLNLTLTVPENCPDGTTIHFTTDGSEPTSDSPIWESEMTIDKTTVVRAKLICDGYMSPRSLVQSYIFHPREITLPIISIVGDDSYFYSDDLGILATGKDSENPNYRNDWRRPVNFEYFTSSNTNSIFNQLGETRVKGQSSREFSLKSMIAYANKRFGTKRFSYEFFADDAPGINEFKSFELRNSGNDFRYAYMRDAIMQRPFGLNTDLDWQPCQPSIFYLNGEYMGLINIRPRSDEDFIYAFYDGLEDIDMLENWDEVKAGDDKSFNEFVNFYNTPGHTYEEYSQLMDVEEYANLFIMNLIYKNTDFPVKNIVCWRPTEAGGKWRWIAKDMDFGLGLWGTPWDYQSLNWITDSSFDPDSYGNQEFSIKLFNQLLATDQFKQLIIDRMAIYMGDFASPQRLSELISEHKLEIAEEFPFHRAVNPGVLDLDNATEQIMDWYQNRVPYLYDHMAEFFDLGKSVNLYVESELTDGVISMNDIALTRGEYSGKWFTQRPITISTDSPDFEQWEIEISKNGETTTSTDKTPTITLNLPECDFVKISFRSEDSYISTIESETDSTFDCNKPFEAFAVSGIRIGKFYNIDNFHKTNLPGIYILRQNGATVKHIIR